MGRKRNKRKKTINESIKEYNRMSNKYTKIKSIINSQASIYESSTQPIDGKRPDKRTCIFYNKSDGRCTNKKCSKSYCITSRNCTGYKRRENKKSYNHNIKYDDELSEYDRNYLHQPKQSGTHERTNEYIAVSKKVGTPVHVGYMHSDGIRRHKARCIYYIKQNKYCKYYKIYCPGSSRCDKYQE